MGMDSFVDAPFLEKSEFKIKFSSAIGLIIKTKIDEIKKTLELHKLSLNYDEDNFSIEVTTNNSTRDPFIIIKGRDYIKLICRGVPIRNAKEILSDDVFCDVVDIDMRNSKTFINRKNKILGPGLKTLKALEKLTNTKIFIYGRTASVIGQYKCVAEATSIIKKCMDNYYPLSELEKLLAKRNLEEDKNMKDINWKKYLPDDRKKINRKSKHSYYHKKTVNDDF